MAPLVARAALRAQWRALLVLALVVTIAVAAVVATWGAAERSETAFERLRHATRASNISVFYEDASGPAETLAAVRRTDGVVAASAQAELFVRPAGSDLFPNYNLLAWAPLRAGADLNVPVVIDGRLPAADRAREIALSEGLAADLGVGVGDDLPLESMTDAWVEVAFTGGDPGLPDGPEVRARVVGIVRSPADFGRVFGVIHLTPAFVDRYGDSLRTYRRIEALADPAAADALRRRFRGAVESSAFADDGATDDALGTIATALRLLGAVAAGAGAVAIVMALARSTRAVVQDRRTLIALGATRRQLMGTALLVVMPAAALGGVAGVLVGVALMPDAMVGLAARIGPAATRSTVVWPIALGALGVLALLAAATIALVVVRGARDAVPSTRRPVGLIRLDRPLPVVLGVRQAVAGESARGGRASRTALVVGTLALAGVVAALVVSSSIDRLRSDPFLFGSGGTDRSVDGGESTEVVDELMARLGPDRRVESLSALHISFDATVEGRDVTMLVLERRRGSVDASLVEGGMPTRRGEVALGPATLERAGAEVGEQVVMEGPEGEATYRVVGSVLFPEGDFDFDDGALVTSAGALPIVGDAHDTAQIHSVLFDWADDVDAAAADRELAAQGIRVFSDVGGVEPARVTNLGQVSELPRYVAAFLGLLALTTLGHALALSGRRRVREQATLRALGLTARAGAAVFVVQAAVIVVVALLVGIPLGLLLGDRIWTAIAQDAHVVVRTVLPTSALVVVGGAAVAGTALAVLAPFVRTRRIRAATALRTE